ncbi:MAG: sigma 54-interacting transcriptional regulator [Planctomycetota bacterium]|nr:sigma 54-interacting transcriptional regulator [Planctomycetota bacterium]
METGVRSAEGWSGAAGPSAERVPLALLMVDREQRIVWGNRSAAERLGLRPDQLGGTHLGPFFEGGEATTGKFVSGLSGAAGVGGGAGGGGRVVVRGALMRVGAGRTTTDVIAEALDERVVILALLEADGRAAAEAELAKVQRALAESERARSKMGELQSELTAAAERPRIIGSSGPILRMLDQIDRVSASPSTVLIHGESGSGKELVARAIHAGSGRAARPLIAVNCASLPESLIESELFGHERGAFTGADRQRLGKFELADGGTLFLDEIAELSLQAQAKLLRVLQEGTLERVGGTETIEVDVRLVAATHRDLAVQVERGRFREDLFYRLNVFRIDVPPLRERREDLRALVEFFHERHARRMARPVLAASERSMRRLMTYRWPGNVRELENAVERATVLVSEGATELEIEIPEAPNVPGGSGGVGGDGARGGRRDTSQVPRDVLLDLTVDQLQRLQIMHALETRRYKVFGADGAAAKLGLNPQTLLSRMDKLGVPRPRTMRRALRGEQGT